MAKLDAYQAGSLERAKRVLADQATGTVVDTVAYQLGRYEATLARMIALIDELTSGGNNQ